MEPELKGNDDNSSLLTFVLCYVSDLIVFDYFPLLRILLYILTLYFNLIIFTVLDTFLMCTKRSEIIATTTTTSLFLTLNIQVSHHLQIARLIEAD